MKHKIKRLLSLLLSLMMLTAALPTSIWAEETGVAQATGAEAELPNEPEENSRAGASKRTDGTAVGNRNAGGHGRADPAGYRRALANART